MPGDRTEKATPHHRQKAAEKGDRARSRDLMGAAAMLAGVFAIGGVAARWTRGGAAAYRGCLMLGQPSFWERTRPEEMALALRGAVLGGLAPVGLIFAAAVAAAMLGGVVQGGGWSMQFDALTPKLERVNPAENARNVFSLRGAVRLG